jgi:DNA repair exonuclease SbcCD nuclease subunit
VRVLHVTDTHLGIHRWFVGAPRDWRRSDDFFAALSAALAPAFAGEVDLVVHTGDLFDRSQPPARAIEDARTILMALGQVVPVVIMPGNHDWRGLIASVGTGIPGVQVVDAAARACAGGVDFLLAHQAFDGSRVNRFTFRTGRHADTIGAEHIPPGVRRVLCGHIHPRQALRCGEAEVVFPGSSERTSFSESEETKGTVMWELESAATWRYMPVPTRPMKLMNQPSELSAIQADTLVRLTGAARNRDVEQEVLRRGAWVEPWKEPDRQLALFPSR